MQSHEILIRFDEKENFFSLDLLFVAKCIEMRLFSIS